MEIIMKWATNNEDAIAFHPDGYKNIIVTNWDFTNNVLLTDKWFVASKNLCMICTPKEVRENMNQISKSLTKN